MQKMMIRKGWLKAYSSDAFEFEITDWNGITQEAMARARLEDKKKKHKALKQTQKEDLGEENYSK